MGEEQLVLSLVLGLVCNANHKKWKKLGGPACQGGFQTHACVAVAAGLGSPGANAIGAHSHKPEPTPGQHTQSPSSTNTTPEKGHHSAGAVSAVEVVCVVGHAVTVSGRCPGRSRDKWGVGERMSLVPGDIAQLTGALPAAQGRR